MNLQEHIRRILKEETYFKVSNDDYSDLIKDAVLSYVDFDICALSISQLDGYKNQYIVILIVEKQLKSSYREELQDFLNKYIPLEYIYVSISDGHDCRNYKKGRSQQEMKEGELTEKCWKGYTQKGMKTMFGKRYPNCVKKKK